MCRTYPGSAYLPAPGVCRRIHTEAGTPLALAHWGLGPEHDARCADYIPPPPSPEQDARGRALDAGGSLGFADPDARVAIGYAMKQGRMGWQHKHERHLIDLVYAALYRLRIHPDTLTRSSRAPTMGAWRST